MTPDSQANSAAQKGCAQSEGARRPLRIDIVTLFPELCDSFLHASILGRAAEKQRFEAHCHQIRDYTQNKQRQTDDYPYGGGCGMVLYAQPIADCLRAVQQQCAEQNRAKPHIVFLTAAGAPYTEQTAKRLAECDALTLVCGHYEGIDERVIEAFADEEISIGDYVLTGGELASLVVADSVLRLQPGVLAEEKGYEEESYWDGLIEYPQYTRPEEWEGRRIPEVLLCGDHTRVEQWRSEQSRTRTRARRPELYAAWQQSHPQPAARWKRRESAVLVKTAEERASAAAIFASCGLGALPAADTAAPQAEALERLEALQKAGWTFYLHSTEHAADGLAAVHRATGELGFLAVEESARRQGVGAKMLAFVRRKLPPERLPFLCVPNDRPQILRWLCRLGYGLQGARRLLEPPLPDGQPRLELKLVELTKKTGEIPTL